MADKKYLDVEDLIVYQKLCQLHLEVCDLTKHWPHEEKYELGSQVRRSSNSSPCQLTEKHDDRHVRNKIEGVNRSRGEAGECIHHLYIAMLKGYINNDCYQNFRSRYRECIKMLNGLEKNLEQHIPSHQRRWSVAEDQSTYASRQHFLPSGWPEVTEYTKDLGSHPRMKQDFTPQMACP